MLVIAHGVFVDYEVIESELGTDDALARIGALEERWWDYVKRLRAEDDPLEVADAVLRDDSSLFDRSTPTSQRSPLDDYRL